MRISALIADDEASARSRLRKLLAPYPIELLDDAHDGLAALEAVQKHRPQVLFLDIQMPGLNGFEVVEALDAEVMPLVVFVTAYDEHALAAFDANAVAYLLKPVVEEKLKAVVNRLVQLASSSGQAERVTARQTAATGVKAQPLLHALAVQRDGYALIPLNEVCFFQVEDGVTYVKTATASCRTNYAINDLESRLRSPPFFRAHRSTIVNLDQVASVNPMFKGALLLTLKDSRASEIQVSERQVPRVRELLQI